MVNSTVPDDSESIDQVIKSSYSLSQSPRDSISRTAPHSPLSVLREHEVSDIRSELPEDHRAGTRGEDHGNPRAPRESVSGNSSSGSGTANVLDFFSPEVFNFVLHNPTTGHRFLRFCQSRACGENIEFLQKVDRYNRLLDEVTQVLGSIHSTYTSADAPRQINISQSHMKHVSADIKQATNLTLPALEAIFDGAQLHVEKLLANDIYPTFVKHQITAQASLALADQRDKFQGLGDCFCLTDPSIADNPILFASDGFVAVTGYSRKDIIPRNCRFLQGEMTDKNAIRRLKTSIGESEETVELLLNYRKNGDPFWNLLYVAPLLNERGELDRLDEAKPGKPRTPSVRSRDGNNRGSRPQSSFFKSWKKHNASGLPIASKMKVRDEAGMESEFITRAGKLSFKNQVEAFYTAYSKYLVMSWNMTTQILTVQYYSPGVIDMLCLNLPNGGIAHIYNKDIFKVFSEFSTSSSQSVSKAFKQTIRDSLKMGQAVSVETGLLTGLEERKGGGWFGGEKEGIRRVEERYVTHWTPLKDQEGIVKWVVLTIAPKV
ncbi:related to nonphototropic hypocotyl protein 1 [Rhynchosporium graminicola]|uniref:Related to nonphototropic hypocotyl protein 1 n=1 Tax=Rhynchosporium graminicola TaxID=2792576 RepID=A0A1E1KSI5_9HELO|nr:related to nonphototropic hypocotyl protein 1 [Rhynchosporium commune]